MNLKIKFLSLIGIFLLNSGTGSAQEQTYQNNKFLIILDVQQYWTQNSMPKEAADEMLASINGLIEKTDPAKIIYIKSLAVVATLSLKGVKTDTMPDQDFDQKLKVVNNNIFMKNEGDAFSSVELTSFLEKNNAKEIIITGLLAEKCVTHTAIGGMKRNYSVYIYPEAIGAKSEKSKKKTLDKLTKAGVKIP